MIDLHCHLLPGIDDGPQELETSLEMASIAVRDGIETIFCTPHIYPGLYENNRPDIQRRVANLQLILNDKGIALTLSYGADVHLVPGLLSRIKSGEVPTLGGSRYLLLEPSHHVRPPRFVESVFDLIAAGYTPIITHPERLTWVHDHYDDFTSVVKSGAWLQVTAGAVLGRFGKSAQKMSERFLGDGITAVLASDAHTINRRAPQMSEARDVAMKILGEAEAMRLVLERPQAVIDDRAAGEVSAPPGITELSEQNQGKMRGLFGRLFRR
jgi:protein-tyrosine phosphatase